MLLGTEGEIQHLAEGLRVMFLCQPTSVGSHPNSHQPTYSLQRDTNSTSSSRSPQMHLS